MRTEFDHTVKKNVVVAGGGVAGVSAAIAACRNGASAVVLERYQCLGGMMTGGLVTGLHTMRHHQGIRGKNFYQEVGYQAEQVVWGISQEIVDRLIEAGGAYGHQGEASSIVRFDPEILMLILEKMAREAGVEIWYNSLVTDAITEDGRVCGVVVHNKSGRHLVSGDVIVDATGDGDVAHFAGAEFERGRPEDGRTMPMSMVFLIGGVDQERMIEHLKACPGDRDTGDISVREELLRAGKPVNFKNWKESLRKAYEAGDLPMALGGENPYPLFSIGTLFRSGKVVPSETSVISDMAYGIDVTDNDQLTKAILSTRERAHLLFAFMRKYIPGFENAHLLQTARQVGIRESRRIVGEYVITHEDIAEGRFFEDAIGRGGRALNVHSPVGGKSTEYQGGQMWVEPRKPYYVPYRALVPRAVDGLLVAGRCISVDHIGLGSLRGAPLCIVTGQAAGTAAALCSSAGTLPRNVDIARLQKTLTEQNVDIGEISKHLVG